MAEVHLHHYVAFLFLVVLLDKSHREDSYIPPICRNTERGYNDTRDVSFASECVSFHSTVGEGAKGVPCGAPFSISWSEVCSVAFPCHDHPDEDIYEMDRDKDESQVQLHCRHHIGKPDQNDKFCHSDIDADTVREMLSVKFYELVANKSQSTEYKR